MSNKNIFKAKKCKFIIANQIQQGQQQVIEQQTKLGTSFYNFDTFLKNLESLDEVFSVVRTGLNKDSNFQSDYQTSEADKILEDLGCVDVVTKSESGRQFYTQVAR